MVLNTKKVYSLFQLSKSIQNVLKGHANQSYWVKAEILKLNYYEKSGHAYPDLVDKRKDSIKAQFRSTIWASQFQHINEKFKKIGEELKDNMKVVIEVSIHYHSVYGLTLNILNVDTQYTLGELARQKLNTLKRLKSEHLFEKNKSLDLPLLPKTLAVISVNTSKGFKDFIEILEKNPDKFTFHIKLFPAVLQGDHAVKTISNQLERINKSNDCFDAVAIIRGGGDEVGFSAYDHYTLAKSIAESELPVLTGIGHSTNLTVAEMVSHKSFITPTKLAEFLIDRFKKFDGYLKDQAQHINQISKTIINEQKLDMFNTIRLFRLQGLHVLKQHKQIIIQMQKGLEYHSNLVLNRDKSDLEGFIQNLKTEVRELAKQEALILKALAKSLSKQPTHILSQKKIQIDFYTELLKRQSKYYISLSQKNLDLYDHRLRLHNPKEILKKGFTLTKINGKYIKDINQLKKGDHLETQFFDVKTESEIKVIKR